MDSIEKWKPVIGYEGLYEVSSLGRVKSIPRNTKNQFSGGLIRKTQINKYGYEIITLVKNNKGKLFTIHRIVAKAFLNNTQNLPQVNHKNGIKTDNRVENLEWCDSYHNQKHRFRVLGHTTYNRKLSKKDVFYILYHNKTTRKDLAKKFGVSIACIKAVRGGRNYKKWFEEFKKISVEELVNRGWVKMKGENNE